MPSSGLVKMGAWIPHVMHGAAVNARSPRHRRSQALKVAVENHHVELVELLLAKGADVNGRDLSHGSTALFEAAHCGSARMLDALLSRKDILVNLRTEHGFSSLHAVCSNENTTNLKKLLQRPDIDVNCPGLNGRTALHSACGDDTTTRVELLLGHENIEVDVLDDQNWSPLHVACDCGRADIAKILLARNDVAIDRPMMVERIEVMGTVLEYTTPFLVAAKSYNTELFDVVFSKKSMINTTAVTGRGMNAIMLASRRRDSKTLQKLLGVVDIDINARSANGKTAFAYAVEAAIDRLRHRDDEEDKDVLPASIRDPDGILSLLLQHGADPSIPDNRGNTVLHHTVREGHVAMTRRLLEDSRVDPGHPSRFGWTPLHIAARDCPEGMLELFLNIKDIDLNCLNNQGLTPLSEATEAADLRAMRLLLDDPRIIVDHKGDGGETPEEIASRSGRLSTTRLLRDYRKKMEPVKPPAQKSPRRKRAQRRPGLKL